MSILVASIWAVAVAVIVETATGAVAAVDICCAVGIAFVRSNCFITRVATILKTMTNVIHVAAIATPTANTRSAGASLGLNVLLIFLRYYCHLPCCPFCPPPRPDGRRKFSAVTRSFQNLGSGCVYRGSWPNVTSNLELFGVACPCSTLVGDFAMGRGLRI